MVGFWVNFQGRASWIWDLGVLLVGCFVLFFGFTVQHVGA